MKDNCKLNYLGLSNLNHFFFHFIFKILNINHFNSSLRIRRQLHIRDIRYIYIFIPIESFKIFVDVKIHELHDHKL